MKNTKVVWQHLRIEEGIDYNALESQEQTAVLICSTITVYSSEATIYAD